MSAKSLFLAAAVFLCGVAPLARQETGSIRGVVFDEDFDLPLAGVQVTNVDTGEQETTSDQGNFLLSEVPVGTYTLTFSKAGYARQVRTGVVVSPGRLTELIVRMPGEFTELEEFVVADILPAEAGSEAALLELRFDSPSLLDSIGSDLMSRAGASDAAAALKLVTGASVQDGKFAVIRGLPDRYVSSQMNGVRLPTADEDKRAVELDQFPAAVLDSIQVSKTFTPDQQGDASGGAVNVRLRGIPEEAVFKFKSQYGYTSGTTNRNDFLTYRDGGLEFWGIDDGRRDEQINNIDSPWAGSMGVARGDAPIDTKWGLDIGDKWQLSDDLKVGGFVSLFYERDSSFTDDKIDDSLWVRNPMNGDTLSPHVVQGEAPGPDGTGDYRTALFDVVEGSQSVQWGGLQTLAMELDSDAWGYHRLGLTGLYTHTTEDKAILAEDTRAKSFFFPGYDQNDPGDPGNAEFQAAPFLRTETLEYTERKTGTLQLAGQHTLPTQPFRLGSGITFTEPEIEWTASRSFARSNQPDKRVFGQYFDPRGTGQWLSYKPSAQFFFGNAQRTYRNIEEDSQQYSVDLRFPFEQWTGDRGVVQFGLYDDRVDRSFDQNNYSNTDQLEPSFDGGFDDFWSESFPFSDQVIREVDTDVDYEGDFDVSAIYGMIDLPLSSQVSIVGGVRLESTKIQVVNSPEPLAFWFPIGATAAEALDTPGEADANFDQDDVLPAIGFNYEASDEITIRGSYSETIARQTFKELTPILQQEFLGGPAFVGNPELRTASLQNYDLRLDYKPYEGGLVSMSAFYKDIEDPIEYFQNTNLGFTTVTNYPEGELKGVELEVRQDLGHFWGDFEGVSVGANGTLIDSKVRLPDDEIQGFVNLGIPFTTRDAVDAPEYLYNLFVTYDLPGTQFGLFYTVQGDTLITGAGREGGSINFVPDVYAEEVGTLNLSLSQKVGKHLTIKFQAKNITDPEIKTEFRSGFGDGTETSYRRGAEYSLSVTFSL